MNYKKADDERIKKNRQAVDKGREKVTKQTNDLENRTYSGKALTALSKGEYSTLKGSTYNRVPELQPNNTRPSTRYQNQNVTTTRTRQSTRDTKYDKDFDRHYGYRFGDFSGERYYDPKTETSTEYWRKDREDIKKKYGWDDKQFDLHWNAYNDEKNKKIADTEVDLAKKTAKDSSLLGTLQSFAYLPQAMIEGGATMLSNLLPKKYKAQNADDTNFTGTRVKQAARQTVKDEHIKSKGGQIAYDIGTGLGDMAISAGVPVLGTASLGAETAARNNMQALERGADPTRAALTGLTTGVVSGAMNKVGLDKALASGTIKEAAKKEGLENLLEDVVNLGLDKAINQNKSQLDTLKDYYTSQGMDDLSAWKQVIKDTGLDLATSYGSGALFGGLMKVPSLGKTPDVPNDVPKVPELTGDPTVDNAIKQTVDAEAKIQDLQNQIPKAPETVETPTETPKSAPKTEPPSFEDNMRQLEIAKIQTELDLNSEMQEAVKTGRTKDGQMLTGITDADAELKRLAGERSRLEQRLNELTPQDVKDNADIDALTNYVNSQKNKTANESTPKNPSITSKPVDSKPIKEQLSPEDRASIFGGTRKGKRTQGLTDAVGYAKKFAGDTDEAKKLATECKELLESYVESGDIEEYDALLHKIEDLDNLARNTKAEYKTKKGDVFTYDKYFTDFDEKGNKVPSSLLERFVYNRSLNNSVKKLQNARKAQIETTNAPTMDPTHELSQEEVSKLQDVANGKYDIPENGNEVPNVKPSEPTPPGNNPPNNNVPEVGEKVRSFSKRGSMDDTLPDEVRNVLKSDYYKVARNADTEAKANSLFNPDNLTDTRSNLEQLLEKKDPASALLSYKLAGAYVDAKQYDAATDVLRQVSEKLTEAGQFTQAAKLAMVKNDPMAALRMYQRDLDSINQWGKEKYGKKWEKLKLTDADKEAFRGIKEGDAEALSDLVDNLNSRFGKEIPSTWWDKVVSATKTSMLLNPRTQVRNITANMALLPIRSATDRVSALGQNIAHLIDPDVKVTQSLTGGSKEQKDIAGKIFDNMKSEILGENKMKDSTKSDILSHRQTFNDDFFAKWVNNLTNGGVEKLNKMLGSDANKSTMETLQNFTYWLMGDFGDAPFVKKNFVNRLASYMKAQGINNIDDVPDDAIALATQEALKATFKDDNAFTKALQGVKQKTGKFGEVALPFTKTPANLAVRAYDYSPLGIISTIKKAKSGAEIGEVIDDLSKNLTGTAMILLGMKLRDKGILSGNYSDDKDEAAAQKRQGMLENAFHIGNKYFTYDWAQPAATPLVLGSVIQDAINASDAQNKEAKDIVNATWRGGIKVANTIINSSPLQSLSDMLGSSSYSDDDGPAENIAKEIIEFPQRFIPSVLGATARVSDPYYRETYTNDGGLTGILKSQVDSAKAKIPELSKTLPISYDTWGQARRRSNTTGEAALAQYVNPGQFGIDTSIPIDKDIQAIYDATGNNAVFPKYAPRSVDLGNDGTIKLDNRQHSEYQKELGQLSRNFAEGLLGNSEFKNLSDDQKAEMLGNAYNFANAKTKEKLFDHVTDVGKHLNEAYESGGVDGAVKYWIDNKKADELGLSYETYIKKESEQPGSAAQYAQDNQQLNAINEKYGTNIQMSTYEKYGAQGVEQRAQNTNEALKYGFVDKDGGANIDSYEKAVSIVGNNDASLRAYSDYKKQGFEKNNQRVPYLLDNNSFSAEQKGMIIAGTNPDELSNTAKELYKIGGYEGVWDYYMLKNMFDKDDSGGLNKNEKSELYAFMNSDSPYVTSIPDDVYYYLGSIKRW